jgi:hypothetical protein
MAKRPNRRTREAMRAHARLGLPVWKPEPPPEPTPEPPPGPDHAAHVAAWRHVQTFGWAMPDRDAHARRKSGSKLAPVTELARRNAGKFRTRRYDGWSPRYVHADAQGGKPARARQSWRLTGPAGPAVTVK